MLVLAAAVLVALGTVPQTDCRLRAPVAGLVVQPFAPVGRYAGHWGIDFAVPEGTAVHPADAGVVVFADRVVDNLAVTVDHGGDVRTTYSYLREVEVAVGTRVTQSTRLGTTGLAHGTAGLHFSLRIAGRYVDPIAGLRCPAAPAAALEPAEAAEFLFVGQNFGGKIYGQVTTFGVRMVSYTKFDKTL